MQTWSVKKKITIFNEKFLDRLSNSQIKSTSRWGTFKMTYP